MLLGHQEMTLPMKKCLDDAFSCLTFGGVSLGQHMEGVQHWSVAQHGGDGWVVST